MHPLRNGSTTTTSPLAALFLLVVGTTAILLLLLVPTVSSSSSSSSSEQQQQQQQHTCSLQDKTCQEPVVESGLKPMTYDLDGYGDEETFLAYVVPDVSSFYQGAEPGSKKANQPSFNGLAGKFFNLSPERMKLFWDPGNGGAPALIARAEPFKAVGTATFPGHRFYFTLLNPMSRVEVRHRFQVVAETNLYVFDPFVTTTDARSIDELTPEDYEKYVAQRRTLRFSEYYQAFTGRDWISRFPRTPPRHYMWPVEYLGQTHTVETRETHFVSLPQNIKTKVSKYGTTEAERQALLPYRTTNDNLTLNLTALSIAPRVFEIPNFLSPVEVDHIMELATGMTLGASTVSGGTDEGRGATKTRTSTNSWVYRETSAVTDAIYRRAADVLRIDEALLRHRRKEEYEDFPAPGRRYSGTIAEALQLVHYDVGQEYTAHHDFGYPPVLDENQSARFCTLLLYLNEGMQGGETSFPRWVNAETRNALKAKPEKGKAVLFYSFLPDGNMDDLSQHAAVPVIKGEKWLINLWVWEPIFH